MKGYQIDLPEKITFKKPSLIRVNENLENFRETLTEKYSSTKFFLVHIFKYSVWIRKITDKRNSVFGHFSHCEIDKNFPVDITCSKLKTETLEKSVKYVQS